jgi:hydrogenase expression/formation protein HypC
MCLAIPGEIVSIDGKKAMVNFGGIKRMVDLSFLEETKVGDWVLVHVGFAIQLIDKESAHEVYRLLYETRRTELEGELAS